MRFMLDTDSCIALIKRKPGTILRRLMSLSPGEAGISAITLAELRYGALRRGWGESRMLKLRSKIAHPAVVWAGPELVETYAKLRAAAIDQHADLTMELRCLERELLGELARHDLGGRDAAAIQAL
jgi:predicted nucleic acid-binding protein